MADLYLSIDASIMKWIYSIAEALDSPTELFDFDAVADEEELEQKDLVGPINYHMMVDETLAEVGFKIAVCTYQDKQNQRLKKAINSIVNLSSGKVVNIPIVDHQTGNPIGTLTSNGEYYVSPVERVKSRTRPIQFVGFSFRLNLSF